MTSTTVPVGPPAEAAVLRARAASKADLLFWCVCALGLINVWRIQVLYSGLLSPLRLGLVFTGVALFAWFQAADPQRRFHRMLSVPDVRIMLLFFGVALAGVPLGIYPGNALEFIQNSYLATVLYFLYTVAAIRSRTDAERLLLVHVIGAAVYSLFVLTRFSVGSSGRLANLPSYDANDAAMLLVCTMPLAVYFMRKGVSPALRVVMIAAFVAFAVLLVRSGSRGGFIGFIATMTFLLIRFRAIAFRIRAAALVVGVGTILLAGTERYWEMMRTLLNPTEDYNYTGAGGRKQIWERGMGYMLRHPIAGVGVNNFGAAEGRAEHNRLRVAEGKGWIWAAPHNSFVQVGAETGLPGLALFLALVVMAFGYTLKRAPRSPPPAEASGWAMRGAIAGALIGYCFAGFFLSQGYSSYLYSLLGIVAGLKKIESEPRPGAPGSGARVPPPVGRRSRRA